METRLGAPLSVSVRHRLGELALEVAFTAEAGCVTALFGRSGAGKTSLLKMVAGLLAPDAGRIAIGDALWFDSAEGSAVPTAARGIGYVFQDARLFPHKSVRANLLYGARHARGRPPVARFDDVVDLLGLSALLQRRPGGLSGGERQRVALGRALLSHPRVLLMDEPLAALDGARKAAILPLIESIRAAVTLPILYVSHEPQELARLAQKVVVLQEGSVKAEGPPSAVLAGGPADGPVSQLAGRVVGKNASDGLFEIAAGGGRLLVPAFSAGLGDSVTLDIAARDVMLAQTRPAGISALNMLDATIDAITPVDAARVDVMLTVGPAQLVARITRRSAVQMGLDAGQMVLAIIKSVALADRQTGMVRHIDL